MKQLTNVTLVNGLNEIYQLFTQLYPELVQQVTEWHQWGEYTDKHRGLIIQLYNGSRLIFSVCNFGDEEGWVVSGAYMVPTFVKHVPEQVAGSPMAVNIGATDKPDELLEIFSQMFPNYQTEINPASSSALQMA